MADNGRLRRVAEETGVAAGSGVAGAAAYQASGYGAKHANYKVQNKKLYRDPKKRRGYTKPEYKKAVEEAKKTHGAGTKEFWRNFPDVPSGRANRALARTHGGKTGLALTAAASGAAGVAGVKSYRDKVSKSEKKQGYAEAAAGAGILGTVANFKAVEHKIVDHKTKKIDAKISAKKAEIGTKGTPLAQRKTLSGQVVGSSASQKSTKRGRLKRLHGELNTLRAEKNAIKRPYLHGNSKATWAGVALGAPMLVAGAHKTADEVKKKYDHNDVNAALAGGVAGVGGYQGASLAARKIDRKYEAKIAADPKLRAKARTYRNESGLPKNAKPGDAGWGKYFRNYPKDLPGGKFKRVMAHATTGKSGVVATTAVGVAGAAGAVKAKRAHEKKLQKNLNAFGVNHVA